MSTITREKPKYKRETETKTPTEQVMSKCQRPEHVDAL